MMNDRTRIMRQPRRAGPAVRTAAIIIAAAAPALLAAACGSASPSATGPGGSPSARGSAGSPSAVGFSRCMRAHGVPDYPDPGSSGVLPKGSPQRFGVSSSQFTTARTACQHLLPDNGGALTADSLQQCELTGDCPQALVQQAMTQLRIFAGCMRSHGVPHWPDPSIDSQGRPGFTISVSQLGFDPHSARIANKADECGHAMHPDVGTPLRVSP